MPNPETTQRIRNAKRLLNETFSTPGADDPTYPRRVENAKKFLKEAEKK